MLLSKIRTILRILAAVAAAGTLGMGVMVVMPSVSAAGIEPARSAAAGATSADQHGRPKVEKAKNDDDAKGEEAFKRWTYPNATPGEVSHSHRTVTGETEGRSCTGHYSTSDPFHEVVRYYVERSGFEPPNWSILGRKFPGDAINMPATWTQWDKANSLTLHHHIRQASATAGLLKSDFDGGETVSVSISCGIRDTKTSIQVTRHARN